MVTIPTTDRQFYNTERKENGLFAYSEALEQPMKQLERVIEGQEKLKIKAFQVEAQNKINTATKEWETENASNPNDPVALTELYQTYDDILGESRDFIDPMYRQQYDIEMGALKAKYMLGVENWALKQRGKNALLDAQKIVDSSVKEIYNKTSQGDFEGATQSYTDASESIKNDAISPENQYELQKRLDNPSAVGYVSGLIVHNPQGAINILSEDNEITRRLTLEQKNKLLKQAKNVEFEGLLKHLANNPYDEDARKHLEQHYGDREEFKKAEEKIEEYKTETTISTPEQAVSVLNTVSNDVRAVSNDVRDQPLNEPVVEGIFFSKTVASLKSILDSGLEDKQKEEYAKAIYGLIYDGVYRNNYEKLIDFTTNARATAEHYKEISDKTVDASTPNYTGDILGVHGASYMQKPDPKEVAKKTTDLKNKIMNNVQTFIKNGTELAITYMNDGQFDAVDKVIADMNVNIACELYPEYAHDIKNGKLNPGDILISYETGEAVKYMGIKNGDILVLVEQQKTTR